MTILKYTLFLLALFAASIVDVKKKIVPNIVQCLLLALGCIDCSLDHILCGVLIFFVFFIVACTGDLGGGDIKLAALCGLVMGFPAIPALILGLLIAICYMLIIRKTKKTKEVPLVPFIFSGFLFIFTLHFI